MHKCFIKKSLKAISILICFTFIILLAGCKSKNTDESKSKEDVLSPTPADSYQDPDARETDVNDKTQEYASENKVIISDLPNAPSLKDFAIMDEYMEDYAFDISYDEKLDSYERTYTIHGEYDLNGDGDNDNINALLKPYNEDGSYLEVNGIRTPLYLAHPAGEMYIIDIDSRDQYKELALYDLGPSDDPVFDFFRYDGKELIYLFSIDRAALMDGQGKFISAFHLTTRFNPKFYSAWGEYKNGEYVINNTDISQYIGRTYEIDGMAFFIPMDEEPDNYYDHIIWESEAQKEFENNKIKLLGIHIDEYDPILNWFFVELPDGQKGLLYFWIGD